MASQMASGRPAIGLDGVEVLARGCVAGEDELRRSSACRNTPKSPSPCDQHATIGMPCRRADIPLDFRDRANANRLGFRQVKPPQLSLLEETERGIIRGEERLVGLARRNLPQGKRSQIAETLLAPVPHRQVVLTIPKRLSRVNMRTTAVTVRAATRARSPRSARRYRHHVRRADSNRRGLLRA